MADENGLFSWWEEHVPDWVNRIFPAELMSIVAAQMGGLVQAAGVGRNLGSHGMVTSSQILLAMLVASAIGNPIRAPAAQPSLRHGHLPHAGRPDHRGGHAAFPHDRGHPSDCPDGTFHPLYPLTSHDL